MGWNQHLTNFLTETFEKSATQPELTPEEVLKIVSAPETPREKAIAKAFTESTDNYSEEFYRTSSAGDIIFNQKYEPLEERIAQKYDNLEQEYNTLDSNLSTSSLEHETVQDILDSRSKEVKSQMGAHERRNTSDSEALSGGYKKIQNDGLAHFSKETSFDSNLSLDDLQAINKAAYKEVHTIVNQGRDAYMDEAKKLQEELDRAEGSPSEDLAALKKQTKFIVDLTASQKIALEEKFPGSYDRYAKGSDYRKHETYIAPEDPKDLIKPSLEKEVDTIMDYHGVSARKSDYSPPKTPYEYIEEMENNPEKAFERHRAGEMRARLGLADDNEGRRIIDKKNPGEEYGYNDPEFEEYEHYAHNEEKPYADTARHAANYIAGQEMQKEMENKITNTNDTSEPEQAKATTPSISMSP